MPLFQLLWPAHGTNARDEAEPSGPGWLRGLASATTESLQGSTVTAEKQQKVGEGQLVFASSTLHEAARALRMAGIVLH